MPLFPICSTVMHPSRRRCLRQTRACYLHAWSTHGCRVVMMDLTPLVACSEPLHLVLGQYLMLSTLLSACHGLT